ncbi:MAG: DAK2 domain-containing protein [Firmicutes bacterium]|nr:DAK2 domain-containing protein [Bacillota bacterium]
MKIEYLDATLLKKLFITAANALDDNKELVNSLNVFPVPDGDTGTNMSLTVQSAVRHIKMVEDEDVEKIASAAAKGSLMGARGNSGVILSQIFRGFAKGLKGNEKIDVATLANGFKVASDTAYKAVMKPIEGTVLTVARECSKKALELKETETDIVIFLKEVIKHGDITLDKTPEMLDVLKEAGVVDAGGKGLMFILKGALEGLTGNDDVLIEEYKQADLSKDSTDENIKYSYCTEFIINNTNKDVNNFRSEISSYGDSLLVVGADDIIKAHIHTNNPGIVIEKALKLGELTDIKIDNMKYQHRNEVIEETKNDKKEAKKYSFITVAMGEGIKNVFKDLNVDYVILGGQTMNPSTEDILKAVDEVTGENIIILPNNSNIVLAANQARELSDRSITVLPTKTIPQGISALLSFEEDLGVEENLESMTEAYKEVKTGEITFAVRDTTIKDKEIKKDNIIGIFDGDIKAVGTEINDVSVELIKEIVDEDNDLITIFYGEEVTKEQAIELSEKIEEENEDCDIEVIYGGQPLYYYLFSVE